MEGTPSEGRKHITAKLTSDSPYEIIDRSESSSGCGNSFAALSIGAIAQEQSEHGTAGLGRVSPRESEISSSWENGKGENQLLAQY
jgi:hypothetical protein